MLICMLYDLLLWYSSAQISICSWELLKELKQHRLVLLKSLPYFGKCNPY